MHLLDEEVDISKLDWDAIHKAAAALPVGKVFWTELPRRELSALLTNTTNGIELVRDLSCRSKSKT